MDRSEQALQTLNLTIAITEQKLDDLYTQRRELINFLNLNKGTNNVRENISKRGSIEPCIGSNT